MQTDDTYVSSLNRIFQDNFSQTFGAVRKKGKKDSLIYASSLYRRWYYSAMVENTFFSPALMTDALCAKPGSVAATAIFPKADSAEASFTFKTYEYSADSHPVIDDLKRIMEFCVPDSDKLGDALRSGGAPMRSVLSRLSIWDPFYVEFLASIATHLGLVEQFPSIHTKKLQVSHKKYDHFFAQSPQEMFMQIVESTVKFVAAFFHETMFPFSGMFTESRIRAMLSEPINAGELYEYVFESSEIPDMLGILDNDILENAFVSESILVGLLYDKCFLCTFGYYLKLIHPIYTAVYDFDTEIKEFLESAGDNSSMLASLYLPAQHYVATKLGQEVFSAPESRESLFTDRGNVESALKIILNGGGAAELEKLYGKACFPGERLAPRIYEIKVRQADKKDVWMNLEVPVQINLRFLYEEICIRFNIEQAESYSFFNKCVESPFMEYSDKPRLNKAGRSTNTRLKDMEFEESGSLLLVIGRNKIKMEIIFMKVREMRADREYPRVTRQSR